MDSLYDFFELVFAELTDDQVLTFYALSKMEIELRNLNLEVSSDD